MGREITVIIKREHEGYRSLKLVPRKWSGNGVFGCNLTPYVQSMAECKGTTNQSGSVTSRRCLHSQKNRSQITLEENQRLRHEVKQLHEALTGKCVFEKREEMELD